jgi:hypothetical protein
VQKRRERINERLKMLQNLVPNGTKVRMLLSNKKRLSLAKNSWSERSTKSQSLIRRDFVMLSLQVDISTMLEEAVQYVKFLQLQIKLLSSDDTWMYAPIAYNGMDLSIAR